MPIDAQPETLTSMLVQTIAEILSRETAADAITAYRYAHLAVKQLDELKSASLQLAAQILEASGQSRFEHACGTAAWTKPGRSVRLDYKALAADAEQDPDLARLLQPYWREEETPSRFYIR